ncbi:MAG TPA: hypothetical protein VJO34_14600 [Methylomirabilota bacterium]|nr:hypothetical protein [Methylomirabilota bacterium]
MMKNVLLASLAVVALMAATPAIALQAEMERYQQVIDLREICNTGITLEIVQLHQAAVAALDASQDGVQRRPSQAGSSSPVVATRFSDSEKSSADRDSNFYGPIAPEVALASCTGGGAGE